MNLFQSKLNEIFGYVVIEKFVIKVLRCETTLTDEIRNFQVYSALTAEKIKTSREYFVLATLKYSFPEEFAGLHKAEAPDLQDDFKGLGIEVTSGLSPNDERISGESVKYSHAKTEKERAKCLKIIESCGGTRDEFSIGYPVATASSDREHVVNVFKKKLNKVDEYQKKYGHIGLAILIDIPLFFFDDKDWGKWLKELNDNKFEFVALVHWSGVDIYNFISGEYSIKRIGRDDMDALKKVGRMAAEGLILDNSPIWK